jgi:hypothetical protein
MRLFTSSRRSLTILCFAVALALAGCSGSTVTVSATPPGGTGAGTPTATPTSSHGTSPTPTPSTPAPPHAFAWFQVDAAHVPQIWASLNGGVPQQITHVASDHSACIDQLAWSLPVFSPNLTHIVASLGSYNCGDGELSGPLSTITVSSGAVSAVPGGPSIRLTERDTGWINNSTIWYVNYNGLYEYTLGGGSATLVSSLGGAHPEEGVLRGSTLFYEYGSYSGPQYVRRFDMSSHTILPGTISLGSTGTCACSPGDFNTPGWDVSPGGGHIAYEVVTPSNSSPGGISGATFYYANADGSGASQIAAAVVSHTLARILISPNGALIAISSALPSPDVASASVSSHGGGGDPNMRFYHPDTFDYPVWKWDSSQFWAATQPTADIGTGTSNIYRYDVASSSSVLAQSGAHNPWYTIGS